ncbi:MAG: hypothetical protein CL674_15815 [Bdellovibrionaceae bacterium]|nr:hypothetical protein [Pseudobdellovibrionaceae bacterium]|tara:strand:+ start:15266 stop:16114 length:849 start_codon:yes stop_codon:yes gene_type:complete
MYFRALSISFLVHLVFLAGLYQLKPEPMASEESTPIVEIEYIDTSEKQIVADAVAPNVDVFSNKATRLESARSQRVIEQKQASTTGKTENRSSIKNIDPELLPPIGQANNGTASVKDLIEDSDNGDIQAAIVDQVKQEEVYENFFDKKGISSIQDRIFEDIEYGNFTALNTNRNQFYSFYQRVNEQVRIRWVQNIEKHIEQLKLGHPDKRFKSREWLSKLVIILNAKGEIVNSYIENSSGESKWDSAAIQAFQTAAPFVNPPEEMQADDGLIRLSYLFSLRL